MATGGGQEDPHVCAVCLSDFHDPKFLPCHHTFCAQCIQDVADRHAEDSFPCPSCRRVTSLPSGGVASLQTNFYLQTVQNVSGTQPMCKSHPDEKLRFYCVECQLAICRDCKLTQHEGHPTVDLPSAASDKRKALLADQQRLQRATSELRKRVTSLKEERQNLDKKRAAVEKNIRNRHATVVAAADRERDEALGSLQSLYSYLDKDVGGAMEQQERDLAELSDLTQLLNDAITSGTDADVITVAKEMACGRGNPQKVQALTSLQEERTLQRPVLHFDVSTDVITQTICGYMGRVGTMEMEERRPEVKVTERFRCGEDPDVEIFSLCHLDTHPPKVLVSYEWCGMKDDAPRKSFQESGKCVYTATGDQVGKVSYKRHAKGRCMYLASGSGWMKTYCKSPTSAQFSLRNNLSGQADVCRETVTPKDPFTHEVKTEFNIQVGPHRAFDVDDTEEYFAVVEEGKESTPWRSVHLYRRSAKKAISTYTPLTEEFQPSDVCFYTLGEQKVLLIVDELNDNVHVVTIEGDTMLFDRYLCESSPSLTQPMAISVDLQGRLWVGCRGGAVFMIEQID